MSNFILSESELHARAGAVTEAAIAIAEGKGYNLKSLGKARNILANSGLSISETQHNDLLQLSSGDNGMNQGALGQNTFQVANDLIKDFAPETNLAASPFADIIPSENITATRYQQDVMSSGSGWAHEAGAVNGFNNTVPMLDSEGQVWRGYEFTENGEIKGDDLIALRNPGSSAISVADATQRVMYSQLNMLNRQNSNIELTRIEALTRGSFMYKDLIVSSGLLTSNIGQLSQPLGSYNKATNVFTPNAAITADPIDELMAFATKLVYLGLSIEEFIIDPTDYQAIMQTPAVRARTVYSSSRSDNKPQDIQKNLFRISTIPGLMGIPITVYQAGVKFAPGRTSVANTRSIMWGKDVSASSFRVYIKLKNTGMSRVGKLGFFPNVFKDHAVGLNGSATASMLQNGSGVILMQQDLAQYNFLNQKIQWVTSTTFNPMIMLENMVYAFDLNVTVS
jgi:hypothetical protein